MNTQPTNFARSYFTNVKRCSHGAVSPCIQAQQHRSASTERGGYNKKSAHFPKTYLALLVAGALGCIASGLASAATISIMPSKDNTLYEFDPAEGDHSNALGTHFFTAETVMGEVRRGVLAFDIAGSIPPSSTL